MPSERMPVMVLQQKDDNKPIISIFAHAADLAVSDVVSQLNIPRSTATRLLALLVKQGALKKYGKGKGTRYTLNLK